MVCFVSLKNILTEKISPKLKNVLETIGRIGFQRGTPVFLVGGFVRDLLAGRFNNDIDLVVVGNALHLAQILTEELKGSYHLHQSFLTATLKLENGFMIDLVTSRREYYAASAALPSVEAAGLDEDLLRRDFTVNAMAVDLSPENFGKLIDFYNGCADLKKGLIKVMHKLSFVDDPTRILRAIRLEQNYGWKIDQETWHLLQDALNEKRLAAASSVRKWKELKRILEDPHPLPALKRLVDTRAGKQIIPDGDWDGQLLNLFYEAYHFMSGIINFSQFKAWRIYLALLIYSAPEDFITSVCKQFEIAKQDRKVLASTLQASRGWIKKMRNDFSLANWHLNFKSQPDEAVIVCAVLAGNKEVIMSAETFLKLRKQRRVKISGKDLMNLGVPEGPAVKSILDQLEIAALEAKVSGPEEELKLARKLISGRD